MSTGIRLVPVAEKVDIPTDGDCVGTVTATGGNTPTLSASLGGDDTRRSPLPDEVNEATGSRNEDPFEGSESVAHRRSDSKKGQARPLSKVEDGHSASAGARPPSIIDYPSIDKVAPGRGSIRHFRRRSLESGQILSSDSQFDKPVKMARSVDDILAADSSDLSTFTATNLKDLQSESTPVKANPDLREAKEYDSSSDDNNSMLGRDVPIQVTDGANSEYPYAVAGSSLSSRDGFEARMKAVEQQNKAMNLRLETLENKVLKLTQHDIVIPNIDSGLKIAKEKKNPAGSAINTAPFYTKDTWGGYKMCTRVHLNGIGKGKGSHLSVYFVIMRGEHDSKAEWPFLRKVTFILVNPTLDRESITISFATLPNKRVKDHAFQQPRTDMNKPAIGFSQFISHKKMYSGGFVQNDCIVLRVIVEDDNTESQFMVPEPYPEK